MSCPICQKRKGKRFCPAKGEKICSVCCGTEREVSIDCPSDCTYLLASRQHELERRETDWSKLPFRETKIPTSAFVAAHEKLILTLSYAICVYAQENRSLVDSDALASLQALAEAYRTLSTGIYYEKPPDYLLQRGLYDRIKSGLEDFEKAQGETQVTGARSSEIRDVLIFLTQLGTTRSNGRLKGRAFLDFLRKQFKAEEFTKSTSNLVVLP